MAARSHRTRLEALRPSRLTPGLIAGVGIAMACIASAHARLARVARMQSGIGSLGDQRDDAI